MSGIEITGLILGIIPLLTEAVQVARSLKDRFRSFYLTKTQASLIENSLDKIRNGLLGLQRQYGDAQIDIPPENASIIENDFNDLANNLKDITERFKPVPKRGKSNLFRDLKAAWSKEKASSYNDTIVQLDRGLERLRWMNQLFVNLTSNQRVSKTQDDIIDKLESLQIAGNDSSVPEDTYTPSFYVPANLPLVKECLDYDTLDEKGDPATFEGKLKAELLVRIKKRREDRSQLAIVGAVGMRGVGKTCALRGLGTETDIMNMFCDGILFLSFSQSSSEQDVKEALHSIVLQTGGHNLSQEIKEVVGGGAIEAITGKVSGWFKQKKCLFLMDNIWDTRSTGSALLTKLSTVLENCDATSGLVYTTTNEIDLFDATVHFRWLTPYSDVSFETLLKAAGFSREQIVEADQEEALMTILDRCKGLKIALVVAGRNIRLRARRYEDHKAIAWESYASVLTESPQILLTEDYGDYGSLYSQFSITLQTLCSLEKQQHMNFRMGYSIEEAFQAFCVLNKGEVIHDSMLCRLLRLKSIHQAREVAKLFADVNLVEIRCVTQGVYEYSEEIRVHDLVLDYANYLADQNYTDRHWIKGSEIWGLRLLEEFFGVDRSLVSSSSDFKGWWKESGITMRDGKLLVYIFAGLAGGLRLKSGQCLAHLGSEVDRMYVFGQQYRPLEVIPFLTAKKSTLVKMHTLVRTMAQERKVHLSELTCRLLIFASLFASKVCNLIDNDSSATNAVGSFLSRLENLSVGGKHGSDIPKDNSESSPSELVCLSEHVLPWEPLLYIKHMAEVGWTLYDDCVGAADLVDGDWYHVLGLPLEEEMLETAGIAGRVSAEVCRFRLDDTMTDAIVSGRPVYRWADSCRRFMIFVFYDITTSSTVSVNGERSENESSVFVIYLHDLGNTTCPEVPLTSRLMENMYRLMYENWLFERYRRMLGSSRASSCSSSC